MANYLLVNPRGKADPYVMRLDDAYTADTITGDIVDLDCSIIESNVSIPRKKAGQVRAVFVDARGLIIAPEVTAAERRAAEEQPQIGF